MGEGRDETEGERVEGGGKGNRREDMLTEGPLESNHAGAHHGDVFVLVPLDRGQ